MLESFLTKFIQDALGEVFDMSEFTEKQVQVAILNGELDILVRTYHFPLLWPSIIMCLFML